MREFTQSSLDPGNCWQTAVACLLEVDPSRLPDQGTHDGPGVRLHGWGSYHNVLNGYLAKHHGLGYGEIPDYLFGALRVRGGFHLLIGPTVRSEAQRAAGKFHVEHVVVGFDGRLAWDPHPSRAGLVSVGKWGILAPVPERIVEERRRTADEKDREGRQDAADYRRVFLECLCPECEATR